MDFADALHLVSSGESEKFATFDRPLAKAARGLEGIPEWSWWGKKSPHGDLRRRLMAPLLGMDAIPGGAAVAPSGAFTTLVGLSKHPLN